MMLAGDVSACCPAISVPSSPAAGKFGLTILALLLSFELRTQHPMQTAKEMTMTPTTTMTMTSGKSRSAVAEGDGDESTSTHATLPTKVLFLVPSLDCVTWFFSFSHSMH